MDDQQLSWLVIEPGWAVVASDGTEVGYVEEIVGDSDEEPPPSLDIDAEKASWSDRVLEEVTDVETKPDEVPLWKRIRPWLASLGGRR